MSLMEETARDEALEPRPEHRFTFGLWTVGNPGATRSAGRRASRSIRSTASAGWPSSGRGGSACTTTTSSRGARRPPSATASSAASRPRSRPTGCGVGMATTNLFGHPAFKDGAFTSNDRAVRRAAIGKAMRSIDLGAELGGEVYVCWGGREGTEAGVAKRPQDALERYREAINILVDYSESQGYGFRFALEPKPNEPRGDIFLPTVGHALHFITTLDRPELVGVNPEVAHETMAGLSFHHARRPGAVGRQALPHRPQRASGSAATTRTSASARRTSRRPSCSCARSKRAGYAGPRAFDAHAYRNENAEGVWDFADGLHAHLPGARRAGAALRRLPEVQEALEAASARRTRRARASRRPTRPSSSRPRRRASTGWPSAATSTSGSTSC